MILANADALEKQHEHLDDFHVNQGILRAQDFRADLVELAVAPFLRALAAEHGADVVELLDAALVVEAVLDVSAHHGSRGFRAQRQRFLVAIAEGIHFLHHDIRLGAHAAGEQRGLFQYGRADLAVVIGGKDAMGLRLDALPQAGVRRQQVARSLHGTDWFDSIRHEFPFETSITTEARSTETRNKDFPVSQCLAGEVSFTASLPPQPNTSPCIASNSRHAFDECLFVLA